jgi:hypothetical protein
VTASLAQHAPQDTLEAAVNPAQLVITYQSRARWSAEPAQS